MSMEDLSIFWNLPQFLSSKTGLYHSSLSFAWLELSLSYFILFEAIVGGAVSLISFSIFLSFVHRRATATCQLILYPAICILYFSYLLKVFIRCRSFMVVFWGSLCILSYRLQIKILWLLLFQFDSHWSFWVVLLL